METVSFTQMASGTKEDYLLLGRLEKQHLGGVADRVIRHLLEMKDSFSGYQVDRLEHSLQCATRAYRDQASEELVVVALLHDIGDLLAPDNHSEMAAAVLKPYTSEESYWIVRHHGGFQTYYSHITWAATATPGTGTAIIPTSTPPCVFANPGISLLSTRTMTPWS